MNSERNLLGKISSSQTQDVVVNRLSKMCGRRCSSIKPTYLKISTKGSLWLHSLTSVFANLTVPGLMQLLDKDHLQIYS